MQHEISSTRQASVTCIPLAGASDVIEARSKGRALATRLGFPPTEVIFIVAAIEELARNILWYATQGEILLEAVARGPQRGMTIVARDDGPGIFNVELALRDGFSTSHRLGLGLPGVKRLMDEFQITSRPGEGTTVLVRKWVAPHDEPAAEGGWQPLREVTHAALGPRFVEGHAPAVTKSLAA